MVTCSLAADGREPGQHGEAHPIVPGFERFFAGAESDLVRGGRLLLGELNCTSCHRAEDPAAARIDRKQAPVLDTVATRVRPEYLRAFLADPNGVKPGTTMPDALAQLPAAERASAAEALTHLLASTGGVSEVLPDPTAIERGRTLFHQAGCLACHDPDDASPKLPTSMPLVDLGRKYTVPGLAAFLKDPLQVRPSGRMPGLGLDDTAARDVANYLLRDLRTASPPTLVYTYYEGHWSEMPDLDAVPARAVGQTAGIDIRVARRADYFALRFEGYLRIDRAGDYQFHVRSDDGSYLKIDGELVADNHGLHPSREEMARVRLAKGMHRFEVAVFNGGGGAELNVDYGGPGLKRQSVEPLLSLTDDLPSARDGQSGRFVVDERLADKGRELFARIGCASCHTLRLDKEPIASTLAAAPLDKLKPSGGCLDPADSKVGKMYHVSPRQREALAKAVGIRIDPGANPPTQEERIARTLTAFNCYACHRRDGVGGVEETRNARFATTQKEMGDEGRIPPHLDGVGGKLMPDYLARIFREGLKDRPYMTARMPRFGEPNVGQLVAAFGAVDAVEPVAAPAFDLPARRVKSAGRSLVGGEALGCIKCHTFNGVEAEGVQAIDMTILTRRLRRDWFHRYVVDPQKYRPGTRMPASWPMGKSLLPMVLDGDARKQIEAVWVFLSDGAKASEPYGLGREPIPLVPEKEAIVYRNFIRGAGPRAIAVGYPEKANLAFDANEGRIALIWQGAFMDASKHWSGRGAGFQPPLGDNVLALPTHASFARLASRSAAWPATPPKESGYAFRGYQLTGDGRPTFLYDVKGVQVEDFPDAVGTGKAPVLRRSLALSADDPPHDLYFRAAVGGKIETNADGGFRVDGEWNVRITSDDPPFLRAAGDKVELIVPIRFTAKAAKIAEEFDW